MRLDRLIEAALVAALVAFSASPNPKMTQVATR